MTLTANHLIRHLNRCQPICHGNKTKVMLHKSNIKTNVNMNKITNITKDDDYYESPRKYLKICHSIPILTVNGIKLLVDDVHTCNKSILQVLSIKTSSTNDECTIMTLSDGKYSCDVYVGSSNQELVEQDDISDYAVIKIKEYVHNNNLIKVINGQNSNIILLSFDILAKVGCVIGDPMIKYSEIPSTIPVMNEIDYNLLPKLQQLMDTEKLFPSNNALVDVDVPTILIGGFSLGETCKICKGKPCFRYSLSKYLIYRLVFGEAKWDETNDSYSCMNRHYYHITQYLQFMKTNKTVENYTFHKFNDGLKDSYCDNYLPDCILEVYIAWRNYILLLKDQNFINKIDLKRLTQTFFKNYDKNGFLNCSVNQC